MKRLPCCAVLALLGFVAACLSLEAQTNPTEGPVIQFDNKEYNFGKVNSGELVHHTYIVTNTGTATLFITNVHPSCGCTTASPWTKEIPAGQAGDIPIQFNSGHYSGQVIKTIDVYSNGKNLPHATLRLTGTIWKPIEITPATAFINAPADSSAPASATVRIINQSDVPLVLSNVQPSSSRFTATLKETKPGKEFELLITAMPPFEVGNTPGSITLNTSFPSMKSISVTAMVIRRESVQVTPSVVRLTPNATHWMTNSVFINSDLPGFELSSPACSDARLQVSLKRLHPQRGMYNVMVAVPPGYQEGPGAAVAITIQTNHPRKPTVRIPVIILPQIGSYSARPMTVPVANHP